MVNNPTNINKVNNLSSPQLIGHKKKLIKYTLMNTRALEYITTSEEIMGYFYNSKK